MHGRILVTGATGFVGRRVVAALAASGRLLTLAVHRSRPHAPPDKARVVDVGAIGRGTEWSEALAGVEVVVHLAAHVHVAPERAAAEAHLFEEVNHLGSARLYEEAKRAGARLFVHLSSSTVLGQSSPPGAPFDDGSPPRPETPYAASKIAAEEALRARAEAGGPTLVTLRPPLICGPGVKGNLGSLARLAALPVPLPLGRIDNRRTLLSLDNLAAAILAVIDRPAAGTFLLGDARPLSTSDIVRSLREGAGRAPHLLPTPAGLLRWAASLAGRGGMTERLLGDCQLDSSSFRAAFGWSDVVGTDATLRATGAHAAGRGA